MIVKGIRRGMVALSFCNVSFTVLKPHAPGYPSELKTTGDHIWRRIMDLGLLQSELADRLGVNDDTIVNWENDRTYPKISYWGMDDPGYIEEDTVAPKLWSYRRKNGMTRKRLSEMVGVDESTVYWWEKEQMSSFLEVREKLNRFVRDNLS